MLKGLGSRVLDSGLGDIGVGAGFRGWGIVFTV